MSTPVLSGTWWYQTNVPLNDTSTAVNINNSWAFTIKEMLKGTITLSGSSSSLRPAGSKWTVEGSSNGTTALLDGIDRLTGTVANSFDTTKWVHAASGAAHSWIVLKSPATLGPIWMCIDSNSATTNNWGLTVSREAYVLSAPLHTASRPITNRQFQLGTTADGTNTNTSIQQLSDQTTGGVWRAHMSVDASGAFHFMTNRNATGFFNYWLTIFNSVDTVPSDNRFNTFGSFDNNSVGRGSPLWSNLQTPARCNARLTDGSDVQDVGGFCTWFFGGTGFAAVATADVSGSVTGSFRVFPPYIQSLSSQKNSWRGRMPDCWIIGTAAPGDQYPNSGSQSHIVIGDIMVPFSLSASL